MPEESRFIASAEARTVLGIGSRRTLQDMFTRGVLPHIRTNKHNATRILPASYVYALAMSVNNKPLTAPMARAFNRTDRAHELVHSAQQELEEDIGSRNEHTYDQIAEMLDVSRHAVNNWTLSGDLEIVRRPRQGMALSDDPLSQVHVVRSDTLRAFLIWVTPF